MKTKLFIIFLFLCSSILLLFNFAVLQAAEEKKFKAILPKVQLEYPGLKFGNVLVTDEGGQKYLNIPWIAEFISVFFAFFIGAIAIIATVMIMWGGFLWLTAAGSSSQIGIAKTRITNALIGLVLALGSYLILNTVNPTLVKLKGIKMAWVKPEYQKLVDTADATEDDEKNTIRDLQRTSKWMIDAETLKNLPKPLPPSKTSITVERFGGSTDGQLTVYYVKGILGIGVIGDPVMQFPIRTGCCSHGNCNNEKCLKTWGETKNTCKENICRIGGNKNDQVTPIGNFKVISKKDCGERFYIGSGQCGEGELSYGRKILNFESSRGLHFHGGYIKKDGVLVDKFYCTHGCVRLLNRDLDTLYEYIDEGASVSIICS